MVGNISLAKMKLEGDNQACRFIEKAEQSLERATGLTDRFPALARGSLVGEAVGLPELVKQKGRARFFDMQES